MSRSGRYVAIRQRDGVDRVDALGTAPRQSIAAAGILDFACVGSALWIATDTGLRRFALDNGNEIGGAAELHLEHGRLNPGQGENARSALWLGYKRLLIREDDDSIAIEDITDQDSASAFVTLLGGRRLLVVEGQTLRVRDAGKGEITAVTLPAVGRAVAGSSLFGGRALAVLMEGDDRDSFVVLRPTGSLVHNVSLPKTRHCTIAETRGLALVQRADDDSIMAVDLRYGKLLARSPAPIPVADLTIDSDSKYIVLAGFEEPARAAAAAQDGDEEEADRGNNGTGQTGDRADDSERDEDAPLAALHMAYTELFGVARTGQRDRRARTDRGNGRDPDGDRSDRKSGNGSAAQDTNGRRTFLQRTVNPVDAAANERVPEPEEQPEVEPEPVSTPTGPLLGLGGQVTPPRVKAPSGSQPYESPREHLDELLDLVAARAARAIAHAWDTGRLSLPSDDARPFEREVQALVGKRSSHAPDALAEAEERLAQLTAIAGRRALASLAAGQSLPFVNVAREFDLSTTEAQVLLVACAPALRGEIARLYGVLANDENRPVCDRFLVELILGGDDRPTRAAVAQALTAEGPLAKHGLIRLSKPPNGQYLFAPVNVDSVLLNRLRGDRFGGTGPTDTTTIRWSDRSLEGLSMPTELKRDIAVELQRPTRDGRPHRILLCGRRGSGRRSLAAALAGRIEKPIACIDCEQMPRVGRAFAEALRTELRRADLRGAVPCVSGLEIFDSTDTEGLEQVRAVMRSHPRAIIIRTSPEFRPPLDPGYLTFTIPPQSESERYEFWQQALARRKLIAHGAERLASRFRIGPGTVENVAAAVQRRLDDEQQGSEDITERLDLAARQHIETRMGNVATHLTRLAKWEQVALPDDVLDSIREFIGRVQHRRTVYDSWGFETRMATSRGLTALFYGPPGTGKSMVAGLIARELNLDLYRVDLARITSKWIGETEKNLAEVFDAGEDGQCVILFDEADSLFAKRTEVKSSVDRYANLEVNYLLQRLDTFEGVAILTTNLEGSIDNAFKRRMSLRLAFPFPDEDMRVRLWTAHIPPEVPTSGDFDFADLAKRFPMSGGYIRNSALRAAFLAAQENVAMTHEHLVRAIHLEYREMGKLAPGGRME